MSLKKGDYVRHATWGTGVVLGKLVAHAVRVAFDHAPDLPRRLRLVDLELLGDEDEEEATEGGNGALEVEAQLVVPAPAPAPAPEVVQRPRPVPARPRTSTTTFHTHLDRNDAWQTLEALRLGVVPARGVEDYTVAREKELKNMAALFEAGRGCRVIWGDYGAGKTHLLDAAEQLALEQGFAVSRITLDPRENALHHPLRLYRHIVETLQTADQASPGFEPLFDRLADSPEHNRPDGERASRFFSPYLHALQQSDAEAIGWMRDYVRGDNLESKVVNSVLGHIGWRGERVLRMSDYRTYGRMYVHLVGTLACWCADAGAKGLVLLFDEVERVDALASADQHYAFEVLKHYAAVTMESEDLAFEPESLYRGGHEVHRRIPLRFQESQPLATVFALTPLEEIREEFSSLTSSDAYDLHLTPLESSLMGELVDRIATLYERSYAPHSVPDEARDRACQRITDAFKSGHDSFRDAVRASVLLLDGDRSRAQESARA